MARTTTRDRLLSRYSTQLVELLERSRADDALLLAHRERAVAELARIDRLKSGDAGQSVAVAFEFVAHMSHE